MLAVTCLIFVLISLVCALGWVQACSISRTYRELHRIYQRRWEECQERCQ